MKTIINILLVLCVGLQLFSAIQLFTLNKQRKNLTTELVEISMIKYGIFNVDEWKEKLTSIITKKIDELEIDAGNREEMREKIEYFLYAQIERFEGDYKAQNSKGVRGFFQNTVADFLNVFDRFKKDVPKITEDVLNFLEHPRNRNQLKEFVAQRIDEYADKTFAKTDYTAFNTILGKYNLKSKSEAQTYLKAEIAEVESKKAPFLRVSFVLFGFIFLLILMGKQLSKVALSVVIAYSLLLLILGVLLPMIEIDARIESLRFSLMGEEVLFSNQILYYKNKSILEVVSLLLQQGKIDMVGVAFLVFLFSVLFPTMKLICSLIYLLIERIRSNSFIRFMVFKTGKWSMADVMVVAIFMSYIGFSGIINEQLSQLENIGKTVDVLSTNHSQLNEGFFLFLGFVLLSIGISSKLDSEHYVISA